jgi:hypothetical protein
MWAVIGLPWKCAPESPRSGHSILTISLDKKGLFVDSTSRRRSEMKTVQSKLEDLKSKWFVPVCILLFVFSIIMSACSEWKNL